MVVGGCSITLYLHGNNALKGKRRVINSIKSRVRHKFNISIAEVGAQDHHRKILLGIAAVSDDGSHAVEMLERVVNFIDGLHLAELMDSKMEIY